jgi:hypothetical protein
MFSILSNNPATHSRMSHVLVPSPENQPARSLLVPDTRDSRTKD